MKEKEGRHARPSGKARLVKKNYEKMFSKANGEIKEYDL